MNRTYVQQTGFKDLEGGGGGGGGGKARANTFQTRLIGVS